MIRVNGVEKYYSSRSAVGERVNRYAQISQTQFVSIGKIAKKAPSWQDRVITSKTTR